MNNADKNTDKKKNQLNPNEDFTDYFLHGPRGEEDDEYYESFREDWELYREEHQLEDY